VKNIYYTIILSLLLTMNMTAGSAPTGNYNSNNQTGHPFTGKFNANVVCTPQFSIDNPSIQHIGNFFVPNDPQGYKDYTITLNNAITWRLIGSKSVNGIPINYDVEQSPTTLQYNNSIDDGCSIQIVWKTVSANYSYPHFTSIINFPDLQLGDRITSTGCGNGEATFTATAINLTINNGAELGDKTFNVTLSVTAHI